MNLMIVGNGFDIGHGLGTKYFDFKNYLEEVYGVKFDEYGYIPTVQTQPDGEETCDIEDAARYIGTYVEVANDALWSKFEESLAYIDYEYAYDELVTVKDREGDYSFGHNLANIGQHTDELTIVFQMIPELFKDWVKSIVKGANYGRANEKIWSFVQEEEFKFVSFNYTPTLEVVYDVKLEDICYIHGRYDGNVIVGHGEDYEYPDNGDIFTDAKDLSHLHHCLRKKTKDTFAQNIGFFDEVLTPLRRLYFYGFSFSNVDLFYIKQMIDSAVNLECILLFKYKQEEFDSQIAILREIGYTGDIAEFKVTD